MAISDWIIKGFLIPLAEIIFIFGIITLLIYFLMKGFNNAWKKSFKFTLRHNIFRKPYPEKTVKWIMECMDHGIGYYDAKKILMIKMFSENQVNETMWIYDQMITQLNKSNKKNGLKNKNFKQLGMNNVNKEMPSI